MEVLFDLGADLFKQTVGQSPMFLAVLLGHVEIIEVLAKHGANVNAGDDAEERNQCLLFLACDKGRQGGEEERRRGGRESVATVECVHRLE